MQREPVLAGLQLAGHRIRGHPTSCHWIEQVQPEQALTADEAPVEQLVVVQGVHFAVQIPRMDRLRAVLRKVSKLADPVARHMGSVGVVHHIQNLQVEHHIHNHIHIAPVAGRRSG